MIGPSEHTGFRLSRRVFLAFSGVTLGHFATTTEGALADQSPSINAKDRPMSPFPLLAYVGCRTTRERNARGDGIRVFAVDAEGSNWTPLQRVGDLVNPSFLAFDPRREALYTVHGDGSTVTSFAVDPHSGALSRLNTQSTGGTNPAHLALDPTGRYLLVANYASGSVAVLPIENGGTIAPLQSLTELPGEAGPHRVEQKSSHPHEVAFDPTGRFVVVPDKGLDRIFTFRFDAREGLLRPEANVKTREGAGPRHIVFAPGKPFAYVVDELASTVAAYGWDGLAGRLQPMQVLPSIPASFTGDNRAAEILISPDGRFVFVSNRGHDSVGSFAVDGTSGLLTPTFWQGTSGQGPRFMTLDPFGRHLYVANELTDTIVQLAVDPADGHLSPTGLKIDTGSPVCLLFKSAAPTG